MYILVVRLFQDATTPYSQLVLARDASFLFACCETFFRTQRHRIHSWQLQETPRTPGSRVDSLSSATLEGSLPDLLSCYSPSPVSPRPKLACVVKNSRHFFHFQVVLKDFPLFPPVKSATLPLPGQKPLHLNCGQVMNHDIHTNLQNAGNYLLSVEKKVELVAAEPNSEPSPVGFYCHPRQYCQLINIPNPHPCSTISSEDQLRKRL